MSVLSPVCTDYRPSHWNRPVTSPVALEMGSCSGNSPQTRLSSSAPVDPTRLLHSAWLAWQGRDSEFTPTLDLGVGIPPPFPAQNARLNFRLHDYGQESHQSLLGYPKNMASYALLSPAETARPSLASNVSSPTDKPHSCDICGQRFSRADHLTRHKRRRGSDDIQTDGMC